MTARKRRSEKLTDEEFKTFKKKYNSFAVKADAAEFFGCFYQVLDLVILKGSGSPETIHKVRTALSEATD